MEPLTHEYHPPVVWTINVQCQGFPPVAIRVHKDKTIAQLQENIIEQGSEFDDDLHDVEYIQNANGCILESSGKVCELLQNGESVKIVRRYTGVDFNSHSTTSSGSCDHGISMHLSCGDHVCWMVEDDEMELQLLVNFVIEGIQLHHKVLCVITGDEETVSGVTREHLIRALAMRSVCVDKYELSGQLAILGASTVGFTEDFIPDQMITRLRATAQEAMQQGYKAFRITGDRHWTLCTTGEDGKPAMSKPMKEKLLRYELEINSLMEENPFIVSLCMYDRRSFSESVLVQVLKVHPRVTEKHEVFDNFYYVPPDKIKREYTHCMANLEAHKRVDMEMKKKMREISMINQILKREVEQRTRAEHEIELLALAQKQRSQFIAQMSHEIRSPLNGIMASGSLLSHSPLHKEHQEIVETIEASTRQLLLILTQVLDPNHTPPSVSPSSSPPPALPPFFVIPENSFSETVPLMHSSSFSSASSSSSSEPSSPISSPPPISPTSQTLGITPERRSMMHSRSSPNVSSHGSSSVSPFTEVSKLFPRLLHVLIVDDSVINKRVLERMMVRLDRVVCESVMDGKQAVDLCKHRHFDVILMDLFMPVMNGMEATREINNICRTRRRKPVVVAVTASVTEEIRRECLDDLGMAAFITKPINVSVFLQMFTTILPKLCE